MKKSILLLASAALLFAGCAKVENEEVVPVPEKGKRTITLKATVDEPNTRVSASINGDKATYSWQTGDAIAVWIDDGDGGYITNDPITAQNIGNDGSTADFPVTLEEGENLGAYAFYPHSVDCGLDNDEWVFGLNPNITYVKDATNMPMLGEIKSTGASFKAVGAVIKLTINNVPADAAHLLFSAKDVDGSELAISGVFPISNGLITAGGQEGDHGVNIDFSGKRENDMVFYVPVPTGTYGGFVIEFVNANSSETLASKMVSFGTQGLTVSRNEIIVAPALSLTSPQLIPDGAYAIALMNESHLNKGIMMTASTGNHQTYSDLGTIDSNGTISVSAASAWRFVYDASNSTYTIMSMSEDSYLEGYAGGTNLKLTTNTNNIAHFTITSEGLDSDNNAIFKILVRDNYSNERWIGVNYNSGSPLFGMYDQTTYPGSLCLIPAIINDQTPSITFVNTEITVPASATSTDFIYTAEHLTIDPSVEVDEDANDIISSATVDAANNKVVVNLVPNEDDFAKTATLTVSCSGGNNVTLTINQNGKSNVVEDVITKALTGVTDTGYSGWFGKSYANGSGAVYAGYSAGGNDSVQLTSDKKNDNHVGIISTSSGGKVKSITVTWNSNTMQGRVLNVYGKNTAYTAVDDLYRSSSQGTLLGTITYGSSNNTLDITGDYEFVGLRSANNAMYLSEIKIGWETGSGTGPTPTTYAVSWTDPTETGCTISATVGGNSIQSGSSFAQGTEVSITATPGNEYTFSEWSINGANVASTTSATTTFTVGTSPVSFSASFTPNGGGDTGEPITLFHETFGNNTGSARAWNDSYSVKSGVASVYSGISSYTVVNAKQSKNTMGSTQSGLNQSTSGTDASIIIGPLNVSSYSDLSLVYQWKAASVKETYYTKLFYATSQNGSFTEVSGTGTGATTFVERSYSLPANAQVSTLYLKIVWNTSNSQAAIDEVDLSGKITN